jgi:Lon protease-like protein
MTRLVGMHARPDTIPLFPLRTVLFPRGILPLRIFETRYLTMIRDCSRDGTPFGVCLLLDSEGDAGDGVDRARMTTVGTAAEIIDFNTTEDGLLGVIGRGTDRFRIRSTRVRDDGLITADIDWLPAPAAQPVAPEHALLVEVLRQLHDQIAEQLRTQRKAGHERIDLAAMLEAFDEDDAGAVGNRLAELLPLEPHDRQVLLEMDEPQARLAALMRAISIERDDATDSPVTD